MSFNSSILTSIHSLPIHNYFGAWYKYFYEMFFFNYLKDNYLRISVKENEDEKFQYLYAMILLIEENYFLLNA